MNLSYLTLLTDEKEGKKKLVTHRESESGLYRLFTKPNAIFVPGLFMYVLSPHNIDRSLILERPVVGLDQPDTAEESLDASG